MAQQTEERFGLCRRSSDCKRWNNIEFVCDEYWRSDCGAPGPNCQGVCGPSKEYLDKMEERRKSGVCGNRICPKGTYCTSIKSNKPGAIGCLPNGSASKKV
jgi:hypothetical protein